MNVIMVLIDSLNRNYICPYGNQEVKTPNMDYLAERGSVFNNHFISSAPCIPARRELLTGRREFFWRGWGHMEPFDKHLANQAQKNGAVTALVTDHFHYWGERSHGYMEPFDALEVIRGNEIDNWKTDPIKNGEIPEWVKTITSYREDYLVHQYYRNIKDFNKEEDFFIPKTMCQAAEWLDNNHQHDKFFLQVEAFGCHEPFYLPEEYRTMYTDKVREGFNIWPPYQRDVEGLTAKFWQETTEEEIAYIRAQYKGRVTMVDKWLGEIFAAIERNNLWENTMVILTSDHGHELGEKGRFGKFYPHYDLNSQLPLIIYHPELSKGGERIEAFSQTTDLYSTILDGLGSGEISSPDGHSILPLLSGEKDKIRDIVVYGTFGSGAVISDKNWTFATGYNNAKNELYWYSTQLFATDGASPLKPKEAQAGDWMPEIELPLWQIPVDRLDQGESYLFDRQNDPEQNNNLVTAKPAVVLEMKEKLIQIMKEEGVPREQFVRLGLGE